MRKQHVVSGLAVFALFAAFTANSAQAVIFGPGDTLGLPGTTSMANPQLAGTVLEDESIHFAFNGPTGGIIAGTIQHRVVLSDVDGTLDFYWKVTNDEKSAGPLAYFRIGDFSATEFHADWRSDGLGDVPATSGHRFDGTAAQYFNYRFDDDSLSPGQQSFFMFMDTSATSYGRTAIMDVATAGTFQASDVFSTFSPAVPEPMSTMLMGIGAAVISLRRMRRSVC